MSALGKPGTVYRCFDADDRCLYIGVTTSRERFDHLRLTADWFRDACRITLTHYDTWDEAADAEQTAIRTEKPVYNRSLTRAGQKADPVPPLVRAVDPSIRLLTVAHVAAMAHATPRSVRRWAKDGLIPVAMRTTGGELRFRRSDIEGILAPEEAS